MPKPNERLLTAAKEAKWSFGAGAATLSAGAGLSGAAAATAAGAMAVAAAPVVMAAGGLILAGATVYCGYRWAIARSRKGHHDKAVRLSDLDFKYWSCHIFRVAVVGLQRSGKSEIKARLRDKSSAERNTDRIETHIFEADPSDGVFVALIDGRGANAQERKQQFEIAGQAEILVVVMDHDEGESVVTISNQRLKEHEDFLNQLRNYLEKKRGEKRLEKVILVLNKKDKWAPAGTPEMEKWFQERASEWKKSGIAFAEEERMMSAFDPVDIKSLKDTIVKTARDAASGSQK